MIQFHILLWSYIIFIQTFLFASIFFFLGIASIYLFASIYISIYTIYIHIIIQNLQQDTSFIIFSHQTTSLTTNVQIMYMKLRTCITLYVGSRYPKCTGMCVFQLRHLTFSDCFFKIWLFTIFLYFLVFFLLLSFLANSKTLMY